MTLTLYYVIGGHVNAARELHDTAHNVICRTKDTVWLNKEAGHIVRSKRVGSDETGIMPGFGAVDSPLLV